MSWEDLGTHHGKSCFFFPLRQVTFVPNTATYQIGKRRIGGSKHNWRDYTNRHIWTHVRSEESINWYKRSPDQKQPCAATLEEHKLVGGDWNMTFIFPYIGNNPPNCDGKWWQKPETFRNGSRALFLQLSEREPTDAFETMACKKSTISFVQEPVVKPFHPTCHSPLISLHLLPIK